MIPSINKAASNLQDELNTQLPTESFRYRIKENETLQSIVTKEFLQAVVLGNITFNSSLTDVQRDRIISVILADPRNHIRDSIHLPVNHVIYIPKRMKL